VDVVGKRWSVESRVIGGSVVDITRRDSDYDPKPLVTCTMLLTGQVLRHAGR